MFEIKLEKPTHHQRDLICNTLTLVGSNDKRSKRHIILPMVANFYDENSSCIYSVATKDVRKFMSDVRRHPTQINSDLLQNYSKVGLILAKNSSQLDILFPLVMMYKQPSINQKLFNDDAKQNQIFPGLASEKVFSSIDDFQITIREFVLSREEFEAWL